MSAPDSLLETLKDRKIIVTCGTGGVGKTSLSAALALKASLAGRKTLVITIDPAKRLASALGLKEGLTDTPQKISDNLFALMPENQKTFETFITAIAPSKEVAERIFANPLFQVFAKEFSGTQEYMAMKKLYMLHESKEFDLIVLDTPPSRNTLDFLDAPKLLGRLFEENYLQWLVKPASRIFQVGLKTALSLLEKLTGSGFMKDFFEFMTGIFEIRTGFAENLKSIEALLKHPSTGFLMVASTSLESLGEVDHFVQTLSDRGLRYEGLILNRVVSPLQFAKADEGRETPAALENALLYLKALQGREKDWETELGHRMNDAKLLQKIPELARDIHSLEDLTHVAHELGTRG